MRLVLVSDWLTWCAYCDSLHYSVSDIILTESAAILESAAGIHSTVDLSRLFTQFESDQIGLKGLKLSRTWQHQLNILYASVVPEVRIGDALDRNLANLVITSMSKWATLQKLVDLYKNEENIVIPVLKNESDWSEPSVRGLWESRINWYSLLADVADCSFFVTLPMASDRLDARASATRETKIRPTHRIHYFILRAFAFNDFVRYSRFHLFLRKIYINLRKLSNTPRNFPVHLFLFLPNHLVDDVISKIGIKDLELTHLLVPQYSDLVPEFTVSEVQLEPNRIHDVKDPSIQIPLTVCTRRLERYLNSVLLPQAVSIQQYCINLRIDPTNAARSFFLTNNLGSPSEHLVAQVFRHWGVPIISFQHGVSGLLKLYDTCVQGFESATIADKVVTHSRYEQRYRAGQCERDTRDFFVFSGKSTRFYITRLFLRVLVRSLWSTLGQKVVLYAPTQINEGILWPYDRRDSTYWHLQKELVFDIFGQIESTVIIKIHQKTNFPSTNIKESYQDRRHPLEEIEPPSNVAIKFYPKLGYLSFSGDVLIIDHATSTIHAAMTSEIPVVYLDLPSSPLHDNVVNTIRDALFLIDTRSTDWKNDLRNILDLDLHSLKQMWSDKSRHRKEFIRHFVDAEDNDLSQLLDFLRPYQNNHCKDLL